MIYGERYTEEANNNFKFVFTGEKGIEFDSRKDIDELRESNLEKQSNPYTQEAENERNR